MDEATAQIIQDRSTTDDQLSLTQLATWAKNHPTYSQGAVATFLAVAHYYLVAQAHSRFVL